jgi:hypothetical protein
MSPVPAHEPHHSAAHSTANVAAPVGSDDAARALSRGPIGAFVVAGIAVGLIFLGWLCFYFLLFMPRGTIG